LSSYLEGDTLYWEGQEQRGTDNDIILADERGLELLVFYRRRWNEFPGDGFRYLGHFKYVEHVTPNGPGVTRFVLQRVAEPLLRPTDADDNDAFDPTNQKDAREKVLREIKARRGQRKFRDALIDAYDGRCAITGCDVLDVLEAAHITPYLGPATNHVTNGLLLRADLHTLFDMGLIAVDPKTKYVLVAPSIKDPVYQKLHGKPLRLTKSSASAPSDKALRQHRSDCGW
jgi:putative restriction endonuclease